MKKAQKDARGESPRRDRKGRGTEEKNLEEPELKPGSRRCKSINKHGKKIEKTKSERVHKEETVCGAHNYTREKHWMSGGPVIGGGGKS